MTQVNDQRNYRGALDDVECLAQQISARSFGLQINDDFMFFGDQAMLEHREKVLDLRRKAEQMVLLLRSVEDYVSSEVVEAMQRSSADRLADMGGV